MYIQYFLDPVTSMDTVVLLVFTAVAHSRFHVNVCYHQLL